MNVLRPSTLAEFLDVGGAFLARNEAAHGLLLGVAAATTSPPPGAYWALVADQGAVVAAGLRTETRLIVSREGAEGAMAVLAHDALQPGLRVVLGPRESVDAFAAASGVAWRAGMSQGIYENREVILPPAVPGFRRVARSADRDLLAAWVRRLSEEVMGEEVAEEAAAARADVHLTRGSMQVWEVGRQVVSLAAAVAPTPHGIRLNNVYTAQEHRGHGYASALVAGLTDELLRGGRDFVFLHTDLANPTSNALYQRVGYLKVAELQELWLGG